MKKINTFLSILLLTILLAACGTTKNDTTTEKTPVTETENTEVTSQAEGETESSTNPEEVLEGVPTESDSQNYSITVVPGFELTGEEPNKDILYNSENDLQSMRIETFSTDDINYDELTNNLVNTLQASNDNGTVVDITDENQIPKNDSIQNVKAYQIETPEGKVSGYTFEREGLIVKLTVLDTNESPALETFVDMAETIKSK